MLQCFSRSARDHNRSSSVSARKLHLPMAGPIEAGQDVRQSSGGAASTKEYQRPGKQAVIQATLEVFGNTAVNRAVPNSKEAPVVQVTTTDSSSSSGSSDISVGGMKGRDQGSGSDRFLHKLKLKLSTHKSDAVQEPMQEVPLPANKDVMSQQLSEQQPATQEAAAAPAPAAEDGPGSQHAHLLPYLLQHGSSIMALSTLQPGLQHYVMPGTGYIAYYMMYNGPEFLNIRTPLCLGDPVCDLQQYAVMADAFLKEHPKAMFMQISAQFAEVLQSRGLWINSVGGETELDLASYTFSGYAKRGLRSAISSAIKEGITVQEVLHAPKGTDMLQTTAAAAETPPAAAAAHHNAALAAGAKTTPEWANGVGLVSEMQEVDAEWVVHKGKRAGHVWFINRPPVFTPEPGVRKFIARDSQGRLLAFIFFDAVYEAGKTVGYYANVTRMRPHAHPGALNVIIKEFLDRVRSECQLNAPDKGSKKAQRSRKAIKKAAAAAAANTAACDAVSSVDVDGDSKDVSREAAPVPSAIQHNTGELRFVSLGLSPMYQMDDSRFRSSPVVTRLLEMAFNQGSGFYPFKSLAAAKAKYGAGLHNGKHDDPNVRYVQKYFAHSHPRAAACVAMFDTAKAVGLWRHPADAIVLFSGHRLASGKKGIKKQLAKLRQRRGGSSKHSSSVGSRVGCFGGSGSRSSNSNCGGADPGDFAGCLLFSSKAIPAAVAAAAHGGDAGVVGESSNSSSAIVGAPPRRNVIPTSAARLVNSDLAVATAAAAGVTRVKAPLRTPAASAFEADKAAAAAAAAGTVQAPALDGSLLNPAYSVISCGSELIGTAQNIGLPTAGSSSVISQAFAGSVSFSSDPSTSYAAVSTGECSRPSSRAGGSAANNY